MRDKGLGDSLERALKATGIDKVAKAVLGDDCGCEERKRKLNQIFPYSRPFTDDEIKIYEEVIPRVKGDITAKDQRILVKLYNKVFNTKKDISSCGSCVRATLERLEKVYDNSCKTEQ